MRIKSYFAKSVDEAISQARVELGPDALLLNTRRLFEHGHATGYEVVLGLADANPAPASANQVAPASPPFSPVMPPPLPANLPQPAAVTSEIEKLRAQMEEIRSLLESGRSQSSLAYGSDLARMQRRLRAADIDQILAADILARVEEIITAVPGKSAERLESLLQAELESRVAIQPRLGVDNGSYGAVTVLVGPSGSGKTTTLAKLATVASTGCAVRLISLDEYKHPVLERVKNRKISLKTIDSFDRLSQALADGRKKECVLVDTPGDAISNPQTRESLASALKRSPDVDVQLVVPAYMKAADLRRCIERYELFRPTRLLVTKMDEAQSFGTIFSEAAHAGLALSFLTNGPEDIREVSASDLAEMVKERPRSRVLQAA